MATATASSFRLWRRSCDRIDMYLFTCNDEAQITYPFARSEGILILIAPDDIYQYLLLDQL